MDNLDGARIELPHGYGTGRCRWCDTAVSKTRAACLTCAIAHPLEAADVKTSHLADVRDLQLSQVMALIPHLEIKGLGTDITHGTRFYAPIVSLLARLVGTRREDVVYAAWPVLGCPVGYFESSLPKRLADALGDWEQRHGRPARLWELIDLLQSVHGWTLANLIEWVRVVEGLMAMRPDVTTALGAAASLTKQRHDAEGMSENAPGMTEGIVIPVLQ